MTLTSFEYAIGVLNACMFNESSHVVMWYLCFSPPIPPSSMSCSLYKHSGQPQSKDQSISISTTLSNSLLTTLLPSLTTFSGTLKSPPPSSSPLPCPFVAAPSLIHSFILFMASTHASCAVVACPVRNNSVMYPRSCAWKPEVWRSWVRVDSIERIPPDESREA